MNTMDHVLLLEYKYFYGKRVSGNTKNVLNWTQEYTYLVTFFKFDLSQCGMEEFCKEIWSLHTCISKVKGYTNN